MESYEIDQDKFENSVRILNVMPVEDIPRYSRVEIPISYTSFDSYEKFNKFVFYHYSLIFSDLDIFTF